MAARRPRRLAEHDVVGAGFGGEHGVVTGLKSAGAGDALGLEALDGLAERVDTGEMRAVGAGARDQIGMAVEQQRRVLVLHDRRERLGAIDQRALVRVGQPQQHRGDIGASERRGKAFGKRRRIGQRAASPDKAAAANVARLVSVARPWPGMLAQSGGKLTTAIGVAGMSRVLAAKSCGCTSWGQRVESRKPRCEAGLFVAPRQTILRRRESSANSSRMQSPAFRRPAVTPQSPRSLGSACAGKDRRDI